MGDRILITGSLDGPSLGMLRERHDVEVYGGKLPMPRRRLLERLAGADGLVCFPYDRIDGEAMDAAPRLRGISTYSVGYEHVDVAHAAKRGISVGYTPDVLTDATADLTVSLMLDLLRRTAEGDRAVRAGKWKRPWAPMEYVGTEVGGMTLGILGMGRIGTAVARRAAAFGMRIVYHNRRASRTRLARRAGSLEKLLEESDVLTLHVPLTGETRGLVDARRLGMMKSTSYLVNTSRGAIVNEPDLIRALRDGAIAGAALDVFAREPLRASSPLAKMENVVLTPHVGSSTARTRAAMAKLTALNIMGSLEGAGPVRPVPVT